MAKYSSRTIGFVFGFLGALIFGGLQLASIFRSTSSTAPVGLIFILVWCLLAFALFFIFGYGIAYIRNQGIKNLSFQVIAIALFIVCMTGYLGKEVITGFLVMKVISEVEQTENNEELTTIFNQFLGKNKFVLGAIAQKQTVSSELLDMIAYLPDPELYDEMGSLFPVLGKNGKGLAVMRLVVSNNNVSASTVEFLAAHTQQEYVLGTIAGSQKASETTLRRLEQKQNYLIDWGLAQNQNTPQDVFVRLLKRGDDFTHRTTLEMLLQNPNVPTDVQRKVRELLTPM